jgi:hypothetical protein
MSAFLKKEVKQNRCYVNKKDSDLIMFLYYL